MALPLWLSLGDTPVDVLLGSLHPRGGSPAARSTFC